MPTRTRRPGPQRQFLSLELAVRSHRGDRTVAAVSRQVSGLRLGLVERRVGIIVL